MIQRCQINKHPFAKNPDIGLTIDSVLNYEYMGSSEFEFGILSKSLKELIEHFKAGKVQMITLDNFVDRDMNSLVIFGCFPEGTPEENAQRYQEFLRDIVEYKVRTKEIVDLEKSLKPRLTRKAMDDREVKYVRSKRMKMQDYIEKENEIRTDFWWDLNNNIMFSFNHEFMKNMPEIIQNTINAKISNTKAIEQENTSNAPGM